MSREQEAELLQRSEDSNITGSRLVTAPIDELLEDFGYEATLDEADVEADDKSWCERGEVRARLRTELQWLRRGPPSYAAEASAPHALRCPLTHRVLREPARAADGRTYERANILDWLLAADGAVSPVSGRRMHNSRVLPNYAVRDQLRLFLQQAPD